MQKGSKTIRTLYSEHAGKVSDKWTRYLVEYDLLFGELRDKPVRLLEIGVQNGGGLEIWANYFGKGEKFIGCDINPDCGALHFDDPRIALVVGDANTDTAQEEILSHSQALDIVIDDGSHCSGDVVRSFLRYFPNLVDGGIYVVEDLHTSYWLEYEGGLFDPFSSITFFKRLVDIINFEHWGVARPPSDILAGFREKYGVEVKEEILQHIHSIKFVNSLCIILKSQPADNKLGTRILAGKFAAVYSDVVQLQRGSLVPPLQNSNPWSARIHPPDEELPELEQELRVRTEQAAKKEQAVQTLAAQVAKKEQAVQTLAAQVAEEDLYIQTLSVQLAEINRSKAWKIALFLSRIRMAIAPPNSRTAIVLRRIINIILVPLRNIKKSLDLKNDVKLIRSSGLFDKTWYLTAYPDVAIAKVDPLLHYLRYGAFEGRDPGPNFSSAWYLETYVDVKEAGINPLIHFLNYGKGEERQPNSANNDQGNDLALIKSSGLFDEAWYLTQNPDVAQTKVDPLIHFLYHGGMEGRDPGPNFSIAWYLTDNFDVRKAKINPLVHYLKYGRASAAQTAIPASITAEYVPITDNDVDSNNAEAKLIAFYLPQFHPIPENDEWWGKGFTEWANVSKAIPNFKGHYQPHLPGELGFYDLRVPEIQQRQIELARKYGIYGFCFHYYWFNGKRLLERPLNQFLRNPDLDFPFCLCWANENWTRRWDGLENEILIEQTHTAEESLAFIRDIIPNFQDKRYIRINGKPLLIVYRVSLMPNPKEVVKIWRSECKKMGLRDIYLVAAQSFGITDPRPFGFDAAVEFPPHNLWDTQIHRNNVQVTNPNFTGVIFDYSKAVQKMMEMNAPNYTLFRTVMPAWDNTPRKQNEGFTYINSTPSAYKAWLENMISYTKRSLPEDKRFIFINSWNEWGEGAYLEPDRKYGYAYLKATADSISHYSRPRQISTPNWTILFVLHDASIAGAQILIKNIISWFSQHTVIKIKILLLAGGPMLPQYSILGDTLLLDDMSKLSKEELIAKIIHLCDGEPDLIYGNTVAVGKIYDLLQLLHKPIITHVHELEMSIDRYAAGWMDTLCKNTDHFIAVSDAVSENLQINHNIPADSISKIYGGISDLVKSNTLDEKDKQFLREQLKIPQKAKVIIGCGRGMPFRKGADLFIQVSKGIQQRLPSQTQFYWIGDLLPDDYDKKLGSWMEHLQSIKNDPYIKFLGFQAFPLDYMQIADVFLLTSREDPFPLTVLEAAQSGLPIICFDKAGGASEFVTDEVGAVVPFGDVDQMVEASIKILADKDLRNLMGEKSQKKVNRYHTIDAVASQILSVCRKVARKKPVLSVILPNFNHARYLPERLDSIFNQTFRDFEVIILDDDSTDNSLEIIQSFSDKADVQVIRNASNSGAPFHQWIKGLELATAEIIWIAESDDRCEPEFLATLLPAFEDSKVKLAYANSYIINENGVVMGDYPNTEYLTSLSPTKWKTSYEVPATQEINDGLGIKNSILNISAVVFRKFALNQKLRMTLEDMHIAGDWYFIAHAIKDGNLHYDAKKLNFHRRHSESVIGRTIQDKKVKEFFEEFYIAQKYIFTNFELLPGFVEKWETYLRQQWNDFYPDKSFDELSNYYPFDEMKKMILNGSVPSKYSLQK